MALLTNIFPRHLDLRTYLQRLALQAELSVGDEAAGEFAERFVDIRSAFPGCASGGSRAARRRPARPPTGRCPIRCRATAGDDRHDAAGADLVAVDVVVVAAVSEEGIDHAADPRSTPGPATVYGPEYRNLRRRRRRHHGLRRRLPGPPRHAVPRLDPGRPRRPDHRRCPPHPQRDRAPGPRAPRQPRGSGTAPKLARGVRRTSTTARTQGLLRQTTAAQICTFRVLPGLTACSDRFL